MGIERRRRRIRRGQDAEVPPAAEEAAAEEAPRSPSPHDLAELGSTFALTAGVHDPDAEPRFSSSDEAVDVDPTPADERPVPHGEAARAGLPADSPVDVHTERGLRGLVGGGSSQVSVTAAMRARDAARPSDADLAAADSDLVIVRRGWVPREDLPRGGGRR